MEKRLGNQNVSQQRKPFRGTGFLSTTSELFKSIKEIRLLLPQSLAAFSIMVGLLGTLSSALAPFFLSNGALFLCAGILVSFVVVLLLWAPVERKKRRLRPEDSIRYQGRAFRLWFAGHHLSWAFGSSLFIVILLVLFGPVFEVMALGAGALACTCFAVMGLLIGTKTRTLGLCWQSPVPRGVDNWWDYVGTTMILRERYEHAVQHDQKRTEPILWSISRILELASHGGANRTVDLMDSAYPTKKREWLHRFKVLVPLFLVTVLLAVLLPKLPGLTPPTPGQVPDGWLTGILKKSDVEDKSQNDSREKSEEQTKEKKEIPPGEQDDKDQEGKRGENADGQTKGDAGDQSSRDSVQDQGSPDDSTGDSAGGEAGESNDQNADGSPREDQGQEKQTGKTQGNEKGKEKSGSDKNEDGTGSDSQGKEKKKDGTQGSDKGKGKGKSEGGKTEGDAARGDQGKPGKSQSKKGSEQESEKKPGDMETKQGSQDSDNSKRPGKGKGQGQSLAGSEQTPEMFSDPEVPLPPPGATGMLELDLPPLDQGESTSESIDKKPPGDEPGEAPAYPAIPPKKRINKAHPPPGSRTYKPEQYLPNWILALMKESKRSDK